jgi:nucleotide-binding universal stress UspA family protein
MKILLAVDGSGYTKRMLAYLAAHNELLGPAHGYVAVTVVPPVPPRAASFLAHDALHTYYNEQAEQVLRPVHAFAQQCGWNIEVTHVVGHAADAISEFANAGGFDLMVMGTHGHSALGSVVLGSVTTRVIAQTSVPVLLVR